MRKVHKMTLQELKDEYLNNLKLLKSCGEKKKLKIENRNKKLFDEVELRYAEN